MKFSFTALALAAMIGSASAGLTFDPPIPFTQFNDACAADVSYTGEVVSIAKLDTGSFCVTENIQGDSGVIQSFSRLDIVKCDDDKIYENWSDCSDSTCSNCGHAYHSYKTWDSATPDAEVGFCYTYMFSTDVAAPSSRMAPGTFESVRQLNFSFDAGADSEDIKAYIEFMDDNSCIASGPPALAFSKDGDSKATESGASTLAVTAAVAMAAATTMLL